jgi:hypothetical protein
MLLLAPDGQEHHLPADDAEQVVRLRLDPPAVIAVDRRHRAHHTDASQRLERLRHTRSGGRFPRGPVHS